MIHAANANGNFIRKAGKATAALQTIATLLLVMVGYLYFDVSRRYASLQDGVRENVLWSVYQLNREAGRVQSMLDNMLLREELGVGKQQALALRYDILVSRLKTLKDSKYDEQFALDEDAKENLATMGHIVTARYPLFDRINAGGTATRDELLEFQAAAPELTSKAEALLTFTNTAISISRAESRDKILQLQRNTIILLALLATCVAALILSLHRQLRVVKSAGLSLEQMAGKLNEALQDAQAGNQAKSQFMATMGHEIRTPLNAILGMVELLELETMPPETATNVTTIRRAGESLLEIINEILDYSKFEHRNVDLEMQAVDVGKLIESTAGMMRGRAAESGSKIEVDVAAEISSEYFQTDPTRLRQIILNLVSNAVKFTSQGSVTIRAREHDRDGLTFLRFEVTDTGIGIDDDGIAKLFQPFSQVDASITRRYGGTGLGLTICKTIVERMSGQIGVVSRPGSGSTFWFEVPVTRMPEPFDATDVVTNEPAPSLGSFKILVAEDNAVNQRVADRFLRHLGQEVIIVADGAAAVSAVKRETFDLILMDMHMPVMGGIEAALEIKKLGGDAAATPIVAMTANASDEDRMKCFEAGMARFEMKPITIARLRAVITDMAGHGANDTETNVQHSNPDANLCSAAALSYQARREEVVEALGAEVFDELLQAFFDDASEILHEVSAACSNQDPQTIDRLLHSLKGSAGNLGFDHFAQTAQLLRERNLNEADISTLHSEIADITRLSSMGA